MVLFPFKGILSGNSSASGISIVNPFTEIIANLTKKCETIKADATLIQNNVTSLTNSFNQAQADLKAVQSQLAILIKKQKDLQARDGVSTADLDAQLADLQVKLTASQTALDNAKLAVNADA